MNGQSAPHTPPPPSPATGFFDSVRRLGIWRTPDRWVGGVAAGIGHRYGLDPLLVRGLFVVVSLFGGLGLVLYGVAWALLPESSDGRIHLEQAVRGHFDIALAGAAAALIVGLSRPVFWWGGAWWTVPWVIIIGVVVAVVLLGRDRGTQAPAAHPPAGGPVPPPPGPASPATPGVPGTDVVPGSWAAAAPRPAVREDATTVLPHADVPTPDAADPALPVGEDATATLPAEDADPTAAGDTAALPADQDPTAPLPADTTLPADDASEPDDASAAAPSAGSPATTESSSWAEAWGLGGTPGPVPGATPGPAPSGAWGAGASDPLAGWGAGTPPVPPTGDRGTAGTPPVPVPGPGSRATSLVLALAFLTAAGVALANHQGVLDANPWLVGGGAILAVLGAGVLVSGLRGRTQGGIGVLALLIALVMVPTAAAAAALPGFARIGSSATTWAGDPTWVPRTAADAERGYSLVAGELVVDLSELDTDSDVTVPASVTFGNLVVIVPEGADVTVEAAVGAGEVVGTLDDAWTGPNLPVWGSTRTDDSLTNGVGIRTTFAREGEGPRITVDAEVSFGQLYIEETS